MSRFCDFISSLVARSYACLWSLRLLSILGCVCYASVAAILPAPVFSPRPITSTSNRFCSALSLSLYAKATQLNKSEFRHINAIIIIRFRNALHTKTANHARHATPLNIHHSGRPFSFISVDENTINDNVPLLHRSQPTLRVLALSRMKRERKKKIGGHFEWKLFSAKLRAKFTCALRVCVDTGSDVVVSELESVLGALQMVRFVRMYRALP